MKEIFIISGGVYTVALIIFHMLFWRIFDWPKTLKTTNYINRATIQVLNISITFIFGIFAYISFAHTQELINTNIGRTLLVLIAALWLFRAAQQVVFYKLKHRASVGLAFYFVLGAVLYSVPVIT